MLSALFLTAATLLTHVGSAQAQSDSAVTVYTVTVLASCGTPISTITPSSSSQTSSTCSITTASGATQSATVLYNNNYPLCDGTLDACTGQSGQTCQDANGEAYTFICSQEPGCGTVISNSSTQATPNDKRQALDLQACCTQCDFTVGCVGALFDESSCTLYAELSNIAFAASQVQLAVRATYPPGSSPSSSSTPIGTMAGPSSGAAMVSMPASASGGTAASGGTGAVFTPTLSGVVASSPIYYSSLNYATTTPQSGALSTMASPSGTYQPSSTSSDLVMSSMVLPSETYQPPSSSSDLATSTISVASSSSDFQPQSSTSEITSTPPFIYSPQSSSSDAMSSSVTSVSSADQSSSSEIVISSVAPSFTFQPQSSSSDILPSMVASSIDLSSSSSSGPDPMETAP